MPGRPNQEDIDAIQSPFAATMLESLPCGEPRAMHRLFPAASPEAADLLSKLLHFNPAKRITATQALRHPFVAQFSSPQDEPSASCIITIPIDDNTKAWAASLAWCNMPQLSLMFAHAIQAYLET